MFHHTLVGIGHLPCSITLYHTPQDILLRLGFFQKAVDGTYFAAIEPMYNVLSLVVSHFQDRFADQKWLIYDLKREYGYYYDLSTVTEVRFEEKESHLLTGMLSEDLMMHDEKLFQQMWKEYFKSITIKERINPRLHRQNLPVCFWKYLTEKQK